MKRPTILIVDDEPSIRELLAQVLSEHFHVVLAKNGLEALEIAKSQKVSVIVLDTLMPGMNGIELCKCLREAPETKCTPIIMLTAVNEPEQRMTAYKSGADDYLAKPFLPDELVARINRKIESMSNGSTEVQNIVQLGNLKLHYDNLSLQIDGTQHELGQVEYKILNFLLKKPGVLVSRQELNDYIWGSDLPSERALDPHITSLRKKLSKSESELVTVYGKGYSISIKNLEKQN